MTDQNPRAALRAALAAHDTAAAALRNAVTAETRARQMLDEAEAQLREFADVDAQIAQHRAARVKEWAVAGGDRPAMDLPLDLNQRRLARAEAEDHAASVRAAHGALAAELEAARAAEAKARAVVDGAIAAVMAADADATLDRLEAAEAEVKRLRVLLVSYADGRPVGRVRPVQPPRLMGAFNRAHQLPPAVKSTPQDADRWHGYAEALRQNPEARFEAA